MRSVSCGLMLVTLATSCLLNAHPAYGETLEDAVAKARRELEIAKIEHRLYWQVEYPRQTRELDATIEFTRAEVDALEEHVRRLKRLGDDLRYGGAHLQSRQQAELALLDARLRLRNLQEERLALRRSFGDRCRLKELRIAAARARVVQLERLREAGN